MDKLGFDAVIFDMDGVITKTAQVHARAWKLVFDEYLRLRSNRDKHEPFREFTYEKDYLTFVDGKPRLRGIESFLKSRDIVLPRGSENDAFEAETVYGIGNRKNVKFLEVLKNEGVKVYDSTIELIKNLKSAGIRVGVVSSSKNCEFILKSAKALDIFETRVDGVVSNELGLEGKPEGDIFVKAASNLNTTAARSVVVEDAVSGVQAGRNGGFGLVVGVARSNNVAELNANGADVVVKDLADIDIEWIKKWFAKKPLPLFEAWQEDEKINAFFSPFQKDNKGVFINPSYLSPLRSVISGKKKTVFFLDYDGTLTPIVQRPELARLSEEMKAVVKKIAAKFTTAIVSGRMRADVEKLVGLDGLIYAGSHGFDIAGRNLSMIEPRAQATVPLIAQITVRLKAYLGKIPGVIIEEKKFSAAAHYRLVEDLAALDKIKKAAEDIVAGNDKLRLMAGKKVYEILPAIDWNKGEAVRWIMKALDMDWEDTAVIYIGDDATDEDAFSVVRGRGAAILVACEPKISAANFQLSGPDEVKKFFKMLLAGNN